MPKPIQKLCLLGAYVILLTGCASLTQRSDPAPVTEIGSQDTKTLSLSEIIASLERGQLGNVKTSLQKILRADQNNATARRLLEQIEQSPSSRYGSEYFVYTVKEGDSFGLLAKRFLGHSLEFWGLAQYNGVKNPLTIQAGQTIKIPKSKNSQAEQNVTNSPSRQSNSTKEIEALIAAKQYEQALKRLALNTEPSVFQAPQYKLQVQAAITGMESRYTDEIEGQKKISNLLAALISQSKNPTFKQQATRWLNQLDLPRLREDARNALANNELDSAYKAAYVLSTMNPNTEDSQLIEQISEYLHKKAVVYYRNQELERAIHLWDRVLTINPKHEPARVYRRRASKLNSQLQNID